MTIWGIKRTYPQNHFQVLDITREYGERSMDPRNQQETTSTIRQAMEFGKSQVHAFGTIVIALATALWSLVRLNQDNYDVAPVTNEYNTLYGKVESLIRNFEIASVTPKHIGQLFGWVGSGLRKARKAYLELGYPVVNMEPMSQSLTSFAKTLQGLITKAAQELGIKIPSDVDATVKQFCDTVEAGAADVNDLADAHAALATLCDKVESSIRRANSSAFYRKAGRQGRIAKAWARSAHEAAPSNAPSGFDGDPSASDDSSSGE